LASGGRVSFREQVVQREYFACGQLKTVEEIENVIAVLVAPNERGETRAAADSFGTAASVAEVGIPEGTLDAFEKARWLFVEPSPIEIRGAWVRRW
jgi:hypothetical protein